MTTERKAQLFDELIAEYCEAYKHCDLSDVVESLADMGMSAREQFDYFTSKIAPACDRDVLVQKLAILSAVVRGTANYLDDGESCDFMLDELVHGKVDE